jgi:DNA repair protein REV1
MQYLDGKTTVTHIIASSLTPKKVIEFRKYRIVKPAWIVDSIQAGKLLPWSEYRVVDEGEKQNVIKFSDNGAVLSQANVKVRGYRDQTDTSWYTGQLKGSQSEFASTPTPSGPMRSRFSRQTLPTPDDNIDDFGDIPPSHQPEVEDVEDEFEEPTMPAKVVIPPKTSPTLAPHRAPAELNLDEEAKDDLHDSLYADPTPPSAQPDPTPPSAQLEPPPSAQLDPQDVNGERVMAMFATRANAVGPGGRELTAEEHNAILLRDPKIRKSTVVDPNFLEQYYRESRLHHLSTWKADLKSQLQALASEKSATQKAKQKRPLVGRRYILHVDFDSFFAAVSLKKYPEYKNKPVVVAHGQGSGSEIASCNYPARKYGIKNGMWMKRAQELCPDLKILPYDFPAYEKASRAFYDAILATGGIVQSVSIDEALIDVSVLCIAIGERDGRKQSEGSNSREQAKADEIARSLRTEVKAKTGCDVSVGIGSNILLAKVALRKAKPAGQHQIKPEKVLDFIGELQVQDLPGVAGSIGGKLDEIGVKYVKDVRELSKERLVQVLGPKTGEKLWEYSRGIDRLEVGEQVIRKSVSAEVNWGVRFENQEQADDFIGNLCGELQKRLLKENVKGKHFTMKIMRRSPDAPLDPPKHLGHGKCDTHNKSMILGVATNSKEVLTKEALSMLRGFGFTPGELRGIGIQMTKLEPLKHATDGSLEGSQRRLQFRLGNAEPASVRKRPDIVEEDPIQDDPETPHKPKAVMEDEQVAFGAQELNHLTPTRRPLNTLGTQFILPTQVDPSVLAELPADIRSKLQRQRRQTSPSPAARNLHRDVVTRTPTKDMPFAMTALPAQSQLDPDILAALPPDVRAEIIAQYAVGTTPGSPSRRPRYADQTLLPQSPRKNRIIGIPAKRPIIPVKRGRGRPPRSAMLAAAAQATSLDKNGQTLTQARFISLKNPAREPSSREGSAGPTIAGGKIPIALQRRKKEEDDLDPEFLAALPPDIRKEVVDAHRATKLRAARLAAAKAAIPPPRPPRPVPKLNIRRPEKPTFTKKKLHKVKDLRKAVKDWVKEFATDGGPYKEDVAALVKYLKRVVKVEMDMRKAVDLVKWLEWVVSDTKDDFEDFEDGKWEDAIGRIKEDINVAVGERIHGGAIAWE